VLACLAAIRSWVFGTQEDGHQLALMSESGLDGCRDGGASHVDEHPGRAAGLQTGASTQTGPGADASGLEAVYGVDEQEALLVIGAEAHGPGEIGLEGTELAVEEDANAGWFDALERGEVDGRNAAGHLNGVDAGFGVSGEPGELASVSGVHGSSRWLSAARGPACAPPQQIPAPQIQTQSPIG
jgi:hypothetical protein